MFPFTFPTGSLPDELGLFVPLALLIGVFAILLVRRGTTTGDDGGARYVGTISLVTLFVALFAAFVAVSALTDLIVDHEARVRGQEQAFNDESYFGSVGTAGGPGGAILGLGIDFPTYAFSTDNDANYDTAVASGLAALAAGAVFVYHRRRRIEIVTARGAAGAQTVNQVYLQSVKGVAALTFALAAAAALYGVWQIIAPGIAGAYDADVGRTEGISALLSAGLLTLASALIFVRAENELTRA